MRSTLFFIALLTPTLAAAEGPRIYADLGEAGWRFQYGAQGEAVTSAGYDDSKWERVSVPHTWNRLGEYALTRSAATNNKQGVGWYRLSYNAPAAPKGKRFYLDFAGVGTIADVWVNGAHVGQHKGAFSRFRFDVTAAWKPGAANLIVVKADNSKPAPGSSTEHVIPLAGDFFIHGGMYRGVQLITANDVGIDLLDFGGPGVYVDAEDLFSYTHSGKGYTGPLATVSLRARLQNASIKPRRLGIRISVFDATKSLVGSWKINKAHLVKPGTVKTGEFNAFPFTDHKLWDGTSKPYMYSIKVDVIESKRIVDSVTQPFGIRTFNFDPNTGATLNGKPIKLQGVSRHQDRAGRGYALTREDHAEDMRLIKEMGANSIRHAHYQHADEWAEEADKAGMLVWAELPYVTTPSFSGGEGSKELWANAEQQLRELIRQNYNHPSIVMWSIGNEVDAAAGFGVSKEPAKPLALLQHLQKIAKEEDPTRPTIFADCCEDVGMMRTAGEKLAGTADMIGYNRYFGWYMPKPLEAQAQFATAMDKLHAKHPTLPISISEYGAGGGLNQHSDNATQGFINFIGRPQSLEYQAWAHEQTWPVIRDRKYIFGSWVWNMFDFVSDLRDEGDSVDLNTKGLMSFDRKVKKDAFFYYKAQWNPEPMIHLNSKAYVDRPYSVVTVTAYTNQPEAFLRFDEGPSIKTPCPGGVCTWKDVALKPGPNRVVVAIALRDGIMPVQQEDQAIWNGPDPAKGIRLNAGINASSMIGGKLYGSENFVTGGAPMVLNIGGFGKQRAAPKVVAAPLPALYAYWREGEAFGYAIPIPDGKWTVTIHTFEPRTAGVEAQMMNVSAQGKVAVPAFNIQKAAGGSMKGLARSFPVVVTGGVLKLDFAGVNGKAVVAAIEVGK